ncbi:MAG TPA: hypothetical protein G4O12_08690 [Dehalococcoidia bacterium]|nr:hypothetical protein [Dehalococcoidia bacterium]
MEKVREFIVIPQKKPETVRDLLGWHRKLLFDCLKQELKKRLIESSITELNRLIGKMVPSFEGEVLDSAAKLKLQSINELLQEAREELLVTKKVIKSFYKSNETIIAAIVKSHMGEETLTRLRDQHEDTHPNLLHEPGWMLEYQVAKEQWDKGKAAFLTFGTFMDPAKADVIVISNPLDEKIEFNLDWREIEESRE